MIWLRILVYLVTMSVLLVFPFIALIKGAVIVHERFALAPWLCIVGGILGTALILFVYLTFIAGTLTGKLGRLRAIQRRYWLALALVVVYCIPALSVLSSSNAKSPEVRKEFRRLHPILRLGVSTLILFDRSLLITDADRKPEDYQKMGLPQKEHSLHFRQRNGYAHAIDIRTRNRPEWQNRLVATYFRWMGFRTLRHIGTADHLHVSLFSHDRPGGI